VLPGLAPAACYRPAASAGGRDPRLPGAGGRLPAVVAAMERGLARCKRRWEDDTNERRERAADELSAWMSGLQPEVEVSWQSITPQLLVGYLEGSWVPRHATRAIEDGFRGPAASTLESMVGHLRTSFRLLERSCPWGSGRSPAEDNPADSLEVASYVGAYKRMYAQAGHEPVAARPFTAAKLGALMEALDERIATERNPVSVVGLARDQAMLCFMHECGKRGKDCGRLRWCDLLGADGRPLDPGVWAPAPGDAVRCKMFSKTYKVERKGAFTFMYTHILARRASNLACAHIHNAHTYTYARARTRTHRAWTTVWDTR
jgi:hypothetical protein